MCYELINGTKEVQRVLRPFRDNCGVTELIGEGSFSLVYATKDPKLAFKLTKCPVTPKFLTKLKDKGYRNPHLPRVTGVTPELAKIDGDPVRGIWIERLKTGKNYSAFNPGMEYITSALEAYKALNFTQIRKLKKEGNPLLKSVEIVVELAGDLPEAFIDIHRDNVMMRPITKELVIVDPVASYDM